MESWPSLSLSLSHSHSHSHSHHARPVVNSRPFIRRSGKFEVFWLTHHFFTIFYILLVFHGNIPGPYYQGDITRTQTLILSLTLCLLVTTPNPNPNRNLDRNAYRYPDPSPISHRRQPGRRAKLYILGCAPTGLLHS